jgi:hypothetical protein
MCRAVNCPKCGKPTWAGCGAHVEQVLGHVPKAKRCQGHTAEKKPEKQAAPGEKKSIWQRLGFS